MEKYNLPESIRLNFLATCSLTSYFYIVDTTLFQLRYVTIYLMRNPTAPTVHSIVLFIVKVLAE